MNETITFETMPKAMAYIITKVEALEKMLLEKSEMPAATVDRWMNIDELKEYLPDHPAKATIYGWVSKRKIPYHKGGKKLRFLQSDIDAWLSNGKRKSESELRNEANKFCETRKIRSFFEKPRTRAEVEHLTGIRVCSVCRYVGMFAERSLIKLHHTGICPITGHGNVEFLTTNPDSFPEEKQLSLYDFFWGKEVRNEIHC